MVVEFSGMGSVFQSSFVAWPLRAITGSIHSIYDLHPPSSQRLLPLQLLLQFPPTFHVVPGSRPGLESRKMMSLLSILLLLLLVGLVYVFCRIFFINGVPCRSKERLDGKTVIVTGGNTGIGKATAQDLSERGARVILACRDMVKGRSAMEEIREKTGNNNLAVRKLDLASCKSIRAFAEQILREEPQINILINNAGVMFVPYQLTEDGFELTFGVNHLGHFLLTNLLLDRIKASAPSRILVVASLGHLVGYLDFGDMMWKKRYNSQLAYARSKLANIMFVKELGKRLVGTGVTVCSLHPGTINTELTRYFLSGWMIFLKVSQV